MKFFYPLVFQLQDIALRPLVANAIKKLDNTDNVQTTMLAESIRDAFHRKPNTKELECIGKIEQLRSELNASDSTIEITDYGAGSKEGKVVSRTIGDVSQSSSKPKRWALLLFYLTKRFAPERCLEFGTCLGISTLYQSAALALNNKGMIVTMEGAESLSSIAQKNFERLKSRNIRSIVGKFDDILCSVINEYRPFDFVFIDGHHEGNATIRYFERILPNIKENSVIIFDDIHWSGDMKKAWKNIAAHQRVKHSIDLYQLGIIITS